MLFVTLYSPRPNLTPEQQREVVTRRLEWKFDPSTKVIGEFSLTGVNPTDPTGVLIYESDNPMTIYRDHVFWQDLLELRTHQAVRTEDGLKIMAELAAAASKQVPAGMRR